MNLTIDKQGSEPVYEQIRRQIEELVGEGLLTAGTRIPSVRQLAASLGLSKNTVSVAYEELAARHIIETKPGSGTFICARPEVATGVNLGRRNEMNGELSDFPPMRWEPYFFRSEFFGMLPGKRVSEMIRFTHNYPDPELFPFERIKQVATNMLWNPQSFFFDISHPQGYQPLVEHLEKEMALAGIPMAEGQNDIIITGGFQRALSLILDFIVRPGQKVAIESPSYSNLLNLLIAKHIDYLPVPVDSEGMDTEFLATAMARGEVCAVICTPDFHNPTGICMSRERREHLLRLAMQHRVPILEDDQGRKLRFEGEDNPPLKSMDYGGYVIHASSYGMCFLPGLPIAWVTTPAAISAPLLDAKLAADRGDSYFLHVLMHNFIVKGHFDRHIRKSQREYKRRRDAMVETLSKYLPSECRYRVPQGGFTIWLELPQPMNSMKVLEHSRRAGVDFVPAPIVMPDRKDCNCLRLSYSRNGVEDIRSGIRTLCDVIRSCVDNPDLMEGPEMKYEDLLK
ncbi:PLP-dependent aminotransferase family protein [bacterium]|nr:PLP-dependent aminotransferase family protein [bacterium]MCB1220634.1 PLP-dependent aminotransferase family protein [bacterium]UNM09139.1 MAG: PLP-dependent aminotransferase family protein [Planctomycetales bacterium]